MGRWEPGASERLRTAAMALYVEQGYERTTVAEIAGRAGLTSRTFFRYFPDKREVLFACSSALQDALVAALEDAPASAPPMAAVRAALDVAASLLGTRHADSHQRQALIAGNAELLERELIKLASLADALTDGLRRRGVADPDAALAAQVGIAVLRVAFERWVDGPGNRKLSTTIRQSFDQVAALTSTTQGS